MWSFLHLTTLNLISHSLAKQLSRAKFDCKDSSSYDVVTLLVIFCVIGNFLYFAGKIIINVVNIQEQNKTKNRTVG